MGYSPDDPMFRRVTPKAWTPPVFLALNREIRSMLLTTSSPLDRRGRPAQACCLWGALVCGALLLVLAPSAQGAIIGINTPGTSFATINFDDTNSIGPPAGITNSGPSVSPWNGSLVSLPLTTDPNTSDQASGDLTATFVFASNTYGLTFNNILASQPLLTTTGIAVLSFNFSVEYQLDIAGLPLQATLFPTFFLNGTVQTPPGSFATFAGTLDYYGVVISGAVAQLDTVSYFGLWTAPGPFTAVVPGTPTFGTTPALMPNTFLRIDGSFKFQVDPATIGGYAQMVPEPGTYALAVTGAGLAWMARRRRTR